MRPITITRAVALAFRHWNIANRKAADDYRAHPLTDWCDFAEQPRGDTKADWCWNEANPGSRWCKAHMGVMARRHPA